MQMRQSFLFLSTTSLLALTGVPAFAFSISGPSSNAFPSVQNVNYSSNGQTGRIEVKTKKYEQLSPPALSDHFLQTLRKEYRNTPGYSGTTWNFTTGQIIMMKMLEESGSLKEL
jgi:hypothetical protein